VYILVCVYISVCILVVVMVTSLQDGVRRVLDSQHLLHFVHNLVQLRGHAVQGYVSQGVTVLVHQDGTWTGDRRQRGCTMWTGDRRQETEGMHHVDRRQETEGMHHVDRRQETGDRRQRGCTMWTGDRGDAPCGQETGDRVNGVSPSRDDCCSAGCSMNVFKLLRMFCCLRK